MKALRGLLGAVDRWDMLFAGGVALAARGLYAIYPPAAWLFAGLALMAVAIAGSRGHKEGE